MKTTLKLLTLLMLTSSLNANTLASHVADINDTSDAVAKVNRKTLIVMIKNDLFTFDENSTASVKKVDEDMGGIISDVNPKNDDNISLYDVLAEQNKNVFLFANVPNDVAVQTLIKVDTTDSASDTIDNITNKGNNFFHYRVNQKQGEVKKYGFENMNKIRQRGKFVKETTPCENNDEKHKQGDINGTCDDATSKALVVWAEDGCEAGKKSSQGYLGRCDLVVDTPAEFKNINIRKSGPVNRVLSLTVEDVDGIEKVETSYNDGRHGETYTDGDIDSEGAHDKGTVATVKSTDINGNISTKEITL